MQTGRETLSENANNMYGTRAINKDPHYKHNYVQEHITLPNYNQTAQNIS